MVGTYQGTIGSLIGKTAILRSSALDRPDEVLAQFIDDTVPEAFGRHEFPREDFEIDDAD